MNAIANTLTQIPAIDGFFPAIESYEYVTGNVRVHIVHTGFEVKLEAERLHAGGRHGVWLGAEHEAPSFYDTVAEAREYLEVAAASVVQW